MRRLSLVSSKLFFIKQCEENVKKIRQFQEYIFHKLLGQFLKFGIQGCVDGGHKYVEVSPTIIKIQGVKHGNLAAPVNNTLVSHTSFLATDTPPCVLICTTNILCLANTSYMYVPNIYSQLQLTSLLNNLSYFVVIILYNSLQIITTNSLNR